MKKIIIVTKEDQFLSFEEIDKIACKLWHKQYNEKFYANPIPEPKDAPEKVLMLNRKYCWCDMLLSPLLNLSVGEYDLDCIKTISLGSWLANEFILYGTKMSLVDEDMAVYNMSDIWPILNNYLELINALIELNCVVIITNE